MASLPGVVKPITGIEAAAPPGWGRFYAPYDGVYRWNVLEASCRLVQMARGVSVRL